MWTDKRSDLSATALALLIVLGFLCLLAWGALALNALWHPLSWLLATALVAMVARGPLSAAWDRFHHR